MVDCFGCEVGIVVEALSGTVPIVTWCGGAVGYITLVVDPCWISCRLLLDTFYVSLRTCQRC